MRKLLGNRIIMALTVLTAISLLLTVLSFHVADNYCTAIPQPTDKSELIKDGQIFWQALSHHYIKAFLH